MECADLSALWFRGGLTPLLAKHSIKGVRYSAQTTKARIVFSRRFARHALQTSSPEFSTWRLEFVPDSQRLAEQLPRFYIVAFVFGQPFLPLLVEIFTLRVEFLHSRLNIFTLRLEFLQPRVRIFTRRVGVLQSRVEIFTFRLKFLQPGAKIFTRRVKFLQPRAKICAVRLEFLRMRVKLVLTFFRRAGVVDGFEKTGGGFHVESLKFANEVSTTAR